MGSGTASNPTEVRHPYRVATIVLVGFTIATACLPAQDAEQAAVQALRSAEYGRARQLLSAALTNAQQATDSARLYFYLGLTEQEAVTVDPENAQLDIAVQHYERALALRPDYGASLNNLGQLYSQTGSQERALELYARAAQLDDPRQAFYAVNYADLLAEAGRWEEASRYYAQVAELQPGNQRAQKRLIAAYAEFDPHAAVRHLWGGIERGMVLQTLESALGLLEDVDFAEKEEALTIVAVALSRSYYHPTAFLSEDAAARLSSVAELLDIGEGAAGILNLHQGEDLEPASYHWWGVRGTVYRESEIGMWPRDAFRELIRSLGDRYREVNAFEQAERYYTLGSLLSDEEPDPDAFLRIVDILIETDRIDELEELANRYVPELFYGKGQAYKLSQYTKIYRYHRALGVIFSYLERWGGSDTGASAIFQLEHALSVARIHNAVQPEPSSQLLIPEPRIIELLGKAYEATSEPDRIFDPALETAEMYVVAEERDGALAVLRVLEERELPDSVRRELDELNDRAMRIGEN